MDCVGNAGWSQGVLLALAALAVHFDLKARRIPNRLLIAGGVLSIVLSLATHSPPFRQLLGGALVGLALFMPFYLIGRMGAGDVKLMGLAGAFLGIQGAFVSGLLAMLSGGALALWFLAFRLGNRLPYAVAIFSGVLGYVLIRCDGANLLNFSFQGV